MPQHATTVTEYCAALARSRLIPEADVRDLHQRWKTDAGGADADVDAFRRFLVAKRCLTEYQAALIQRGRPDGFFVGGYVILDRLGKGQSAGVYKAVHTSGQVVALKVLAGSRAKDPHVLNRFRREGRLLTQLNHPNVVRAFQVGQTGPVHFIVMEYLEGETLDDVLTRRKRLPPAEAVRVVHQALLGLQHLYEKRMVHRDLKPTNLMVVPAPPPGGPDDTLAATVKILDVGIGRELFDESPAPDARLTTEGAILGTPDYLAPEQARDARSADVRADLYSAGCVLYHLIAGRPPFAGTTVMAQMVQHATETPAPLAEVAPGVPAGLQAVFDRLTAKKREDRYPTPAAAAAALTQFLPAGAAAASPSGVLPAYREFLETESALEVPADLLRKPSGSTTLRIPNLADQPAVPAQTSSRPTAVPSPRPQFSEDEIDVELLAFTPVPAAARTDARSRPGLDLTRRDFVMLGFGAAGVLLAIGAGYGLAKVLKKATDEPKGDEKGGP